MTERRSTLEDWLDRAQLRRRAVGLDRRTAIRDSGRPLLDLAGNDYLGLSRHPAVVAAAAGAVHRFGAGAGASRLVTGTLPVHAELESALAQWCGFEAALVFSTGYQANLGVVAALSGPDTLLVHDAHAHASMVDACRLARSGGVQVFPHNDAAALEAILSERTQSRALVLVETIYSVLGDPAPLAQLADVCCRQDAVLIADEAHALGVISAGRGLLAGLGLAGEPGIVATATLSKALGSQGGAVLGSAALREHLVNRARPFIYDTGLAPAAAAGALAALQVIAAEPELSRQVLANAEALAEACGVPAPGAAVLSVPMPGPAEAVAAVAAAAEQGVAIGCFRPPSTPDGRSRLRITAHAQHSAGDLDLATTVLNPLVRQ